jgi:putative mycofactocin binding protein MftB
MACAVSTKPGSADTVPAVPDTVSPDTVSPDPVSPDTVSPARFDLDAPWRLHSQVSVRPERFGALLYHFGTRRLSFLKSPALLAVVSSLDSEPSARAACAAAGVTAGELPAYASALATLAAGSMICAWTPA